MDDLISRAVAVRIIADMHGLCRDDVLCESIQEIKELPAVNAVPVGWLREKMLNGEPDDSKTAWRTLKMWQREQEAI